MITTDLLRLFLPLSPADAVVDSISHLDKNSNPDALEAVANKMDKVADKLIGDEGGKVSATTLICSTIDIFLH